MYFSGKHVYIYIYNGRTVKNIEQHQQTVFKTVGSQSPLSSPDPRKTHTYIYIYFTWQWPVKFLHSFHLSFTYIWESYVNFWKRIKKKKKAYIFDILFGDIAWSQHGCSNINNKADFVGKLVSCIGYVESTGAMSDQNYLNK